MNECMAEVKPYYKWYVSLMEMEYDCPSTNLSFTLIKEIRVVNSCRENVRADHLFSLIEVSESS